MRRSFLSLPALLPVLLLFSCSGENQSTPSYNPGVGPFDDDGNYVEAWADNPPKRSWYSRAPQPPRETAPAPQPRQTIVRQSPALPSIAPPPVVRPRDTASAPRPKPVSKPSAKPVSKPTPKPAAPTPPATRNHTVAKGDTLFSLSRRYGTSVSAIQKANGLSGTNIRLGQSLKIPR